MAVGAHERPQLHGELFEPETIHTHARTRGRARPRRAPVLPRLGRSSRPRAPGPAVLAFTLGECRFVGAHIRHPEHITHNRYAPHTRRCCVPLLLAEETCVEPVLARVVQVLVEIDHVVLHTCACTRLAPVSASRHGGTSGDGTHRALERAPVSPASQQARIALVPARSRC
eukprot:scaffold47423_cov71-Phaeocystis_antarctica.AAC.4